MDGNIMYYVIMGILAFYCVFVTIWCVSRNGRLARLTAGLNASHYPVALMLKGKLFFAN